ncbi:hypothetical protein [Enterococcus faecalis]|uniref:hypothetical protein n=1 Tax=Enterococcus faecalis TaxID=1351 RepID=UPI0018E852BF|nr:hypothetical protein [Enterococcus faecalis]MBJ1733279.1 hypothetical protein [Enterococcus faecalis]HAP3666845.1 hypothetical protein [Enterococcus faecalis]
MTNVIVFSNLNELEQKKIVKHIKRKIQELEFQLDTITPNNESVTDYRNFERITNTKEEIKMLKNELLRLKNDQERSKNDECIRIR